MASRPPAMQPIAPTAARGHVRRDRGGDPVLRGQGLGDRLQDVREGHVQQRSALDVVVGGGVERDVEAVRRGDVGGVGVNRCRVQDVQVGAVRVPTGSADGIGESIETDRVRPTRTTRAPSRRAVATADPTGPAAP